MRAPARDRLLLPPVASARDQGSVGPQHEAWVLPRGVDLVLELCQDLTWLQTKPNLNATSEHPGEVKAEP